MTVTYREEEAVIARAGAKCFYTNRRPARKCSNKVETWGSGGRNPDFDHLSTTFLVLTAFNSVLPELVVLISTTNSGRTELNAVSTKKVVV